MHDVEQPTTQLGQFSVRTDVYEGPLELLLELIEKRKLLINDISLASVTDEYIRYVAELEEKSLRDTAHFVVVASTLLLLKSRSLLPVLELTEEEEENIEDLEERLKLYKVYRDAGKIVADAFGQNMAYGKRYVRDEAPVFVTDRYCTTRALSAAIQEVVAKLPKKVEKPKVRVQSTVTLEEMIDRLKNRIEREMKLRFKDLTGGDEERTTVIVGFLAVLEMVKQGSVLVRQEQRFDDIEIEREGNTLPRYV